MAQKASARMTMWMIRDIESDTYVSNPVRYSGQIDLVPGKHTHKTRGLLWKTRGDIARHLALHREFYRTNMARLEVVELKLTEAGKEPIEVLVAADLAKQWSS